MAHMFLFAVRLLWLFGDILHKCVCESLCLFLSILHGNLRRHVSMFLKQLISLGELAKFSLA